jgi:hypothetical protein
MIMIYAGKIFDYCLSTASPAGGITFFPAKKSNQKMPGTAKEISYGTVRLPSSRTIIAAIRGFKFF